MQIEPGLEQLKRCFAWIFLLTCVLNVAVMIGMRVSVEAFGDMLGAIELAGERQVLVQVSALLRLTPWPTLPTLLPGLRSIHTTSLYT